jgi:hypothetical protein
MARAIRASWRRGAIPIVLFAGMFAFPLLVHALARLLG